MPKIKIKVECCSEDDPCAQSLSKAFCRLIRYLGGETTTCPKGNNQSAAEISLHIVLNDGNTERLKCCRDLLKNIEKIDIKKERFIFLHINDISDHKFNFWEKLLKNLGLGETIDIKEEALMNKNSNLSLYATKTVNNLCNEIDSDFSYCIIEKLRCLQYGWLRTEKGFEARYIDEITPQMDLQHALGSKPEDEDKDTLLLYSYLREAFLDWTKNKWVFEFDLDLNFLILDDLMWKEKEWPNISDKSKHNREGNFARKFEKFRRIINEISDIDWIFYRTTKPDDFKGTFKEYIKNLLNTNSPISCALIPANANSSMQSLSQFTHILVDWRLDESGQYTGINLLNDLKNWIDRNSEKLTVIPELIILTRNPDPVTIQSALEAGASGYVLKDNIAELPYIVGRAGRPLKMEEKREIDSWLSDNFPSLKSFPAFVPKALYFNVWGKNKDLEPDPENINEKEYDSESIVNEHRDWLKKIPKADLHVHIGVAIPLDVCYDLAIISVYRWLHQYKYNTALEEYKGCNKDKYIQMENAADIIGDILTKLAQQITSKTTNEFRDSYLDAFKETTKIYEVVTVNDTIKRLNRRFDKLSEEQIACLLVTGIGFLCNESIYNERSLCKRVIEIIEICELLEDIGKKQKDKNPLLSFYYQDSTKILEYVKGFYSDNVTAKGIHYETSCLFNSMALPKSFDPLSSLLSIPNTLQNTAQGLPKYIGAGGLVGASLLQFTETLLLASYHIPIWAAEQNVWHQELRVGPAGYLKRLNNPVLATKIMMLGIYAGIGEVKKWHPDDKHPTTSVLITAKRDKDKEEIKKAAILATEFISKNEKGINDADFDGFIPKVLGMDLAGIERGNLPDNLVEQFKESFRRCLMMTVHAGEDESVESVWQAVYSLHASRIGHGLRLDDYPDLKRLFKDRQICVELCPKSNQFTNGYAIYSKEKPDNEKYFVFENYWKYEIPVTINTDDPLLSHRTNGANMPYPLSEEYLILPHLLGTNSKSGNSKPLSVNKLLILKLIYNGFKYSFLSPKEKARLIECADREVFNVLAAEFLNVYISAER